MSAQPRIYFGAAHRRQVRRRRRVRLLRRAATLGLREDQQLFVGSPAALFPPDLYERGRCEEDGAAEGHFGREIHVAWQEKRRCGPCRAS